VGCLPTSAGCFPTSVAILPTTVGFIPTIIASLPTSVGRLPTSVASPPTSAGRPPTSVSRPPTSVSRLSLERIERGSHLFDRGTLAVVRFHLRPPHVPLRIEHENRRPRYAVQLLLRVLRIAQPVAVDRIRVRIGQHRKTDRPPLVRLDLPRQL